MKFDAWLTNKALHLIIRRRTALERLSARRKERMAEKKVSDSILFPLSAAVGINERAVI